MIKRNIFTYLLSFCLSLFLTIMAMILLCQGTLFNLSYIYQKFETTDYYESVTQEINQNLRYTAGAAGIEPGIFKEYLTVETVRDDMKEYIADPAQTDVYGKRFSSELTEYLNTKGYQETDTKEMQKYINIQRADYEKHIRFPFMKYYTMAKDTLDLTVPYLLGISILMIVISVILLKKGIRKSAFLKWFGSALCGSGLMLEVVPILVLINQWHVRVNLTPQYYYQFFVQYVDGFLWLAVMISIVMLLSGGLVMILSEKRRSHV